MSKVFRIVYSLWLNADFSEVAAGRQDPPYVDYTKADYAALQKLLSDTFHYGPPVTLRVADDAIDIATMSERESASSDKMHCNDFGLILLNEASKSTSPVIPVRKIWQNMHAFQDRRKAPPPVILPIVIEAADFEDAVLWSQAARPILGLKPFEALESMGKSGQLSEVIHEGTMPLKLQQGLKQIFGCDFTNFGMLDRMAADKFN